MKYEELTDFPWNIYQFNVQLSQKFSFILEACLTSQRCLKIKHIVDLKYFKHQEEHEITENLSLVLNKECSLDDVTYKLTEDLNFKLLKKFNRVLNLGLYSIKSLELEEIDSRYITISIRCD